MFQSVYSALNASLHVHLFNIFSRGAFPSSLMMVTAYISGFLKPFLAWLCDRRGSKRLTTARPSLTALALIAVPGHCTDNDMRSKALLIILLTCVGYTRSLTAVAPNTEVEYAVEASMQVKIQCTTTSFALGCMPAGSTETDSRIVKLTRAVMSAPQDPRTINA